MGIYLVSSSIILRSWKPSKEKGIQTIDDIDELGENDCVIVREHGIGKDVYEMLKMRNVRILWTPHVHM